MSDKLPAGLQQVWGLRDRAPREARPGLSVDRIVAAAMELADADGLAAVSMSRVAQRLGFTTMSLYRHVANKEELLNLMFDAGVGHTTALGSPVGGWRPALERLAWELLTVLRRHPWALHIPLGPPTTPNRLEWLDRGLAALADTGLTDDEKANVILLVNGYVFSEARLSVDLANLGPASDDPVIATVMTSLVDAERFPALRRALDGGLFNGPDDRDADFSFGLERVLDGIERLVEERARG
jgi:AcrR family transcriptional regulator